MGQRTTNPAGDVITFIVGGCLFGGGVFLFMNQVMVRSDVMVGGYRPWGRFAGWGGETLLPWGTPGMGLLMVPLAIGVCLLFSGSWKRLSLLLVWGSLAAMFVGVLNSVRISFIPSTLWQLAVYVVMIASGGGLMFRSVAGYQEAEAPTAPAAKSSKHDESSEVQRELSALKRRVNRVRRRKPPGRT